VSNPTLTLTPSVPGGTVTPATFQTIYGRVIDKVRLDPTSSADITRVKDWINQAYMQVAVETRYFQTSGTATLTAGQASYSLDPNLLTVTLITVTQSGGTAWYPLKEAQLDEILSFQAVSTGTGPARRYCVDPANTLILWPTPAAADTITFYYSYLPTPLSANGDTPQMPEPFASNVLEFGAAIKAAEFKRDLMMLGDFQQQYATWLAGFQRFANRKQGQYPEEFPTWTRKVPYGPHDPATDIPDSYWR